MNPLSCFLGWVSRFSISVFWARHYAVCCGPLSRPQSPQRPSFLSRKGPETSGGSSFPPESPPLSVQQGLRFHLSRPLLTFPSNGHQSRHFWLSTLPRGTGCYTFQVPSWSLCFRCAVDSRPRDISPCGIPFWPQIRAGFVPGEVDCSRFVTTVAPFVAVGGPSRSTLLVLTTRGWKPTTARTYCEDLSSRVRDASPSCRLTDVTRRYLFGWGYVPRVEAGSASPCRYL